MKTQRMLREVLSRIDGRGYPAYKELAGSWQMEGFVLFVDHVQGDPFASPSSLRVQVPAQTARFPEDLYANDTRKTALEDAIARIFAEKIRKFSARSGSGKSGALIFPSPRRRS